MAKDQIENIYERMIAEAVDKQKKMVVGKQQTGDELEGPTKEVGPKGSGPEAAVKTKAVNAPANLSNLKKENNDMSDTFQDLYDKVMISEEGEDLESAEYNDEMGDFPTGQDDEGLGDEMGEEGEDPFVQLANLFSQAADLFSQMSDSEADMAAGEEDMMDEPIQGEGPMGEATSEPEPKIAPDNTAKLKLPRKLAGTGVNVVKKKAKGEISGKHDGSLQAAPKGFQPGNKGMMKVNGTGAENKAKNASAFEA